MLTDLVIRNFAIIDRLQVSFGPGFNVLTGETGAGKSIIIDAVGLLLGERARPDLIRTGEEEATVEALFDLSRRPEIQKAIIEFGFEAAEEVIIRRVVSRAGKSRIYINGSLATLAQLQPLAALLVSVYGQHEHQNLQRAERHLPLLDRYAGLEGTLEEYREIFEEVASLEERLKGLETAERERQQRLDLLSFQSREIAAANLRPGEEEELAAERLLLQNSERLSAATLGGYEVLYGSEDAVVGRLDRIASDMESLSEVAPCLGAWAESVRSALFSLEDVAEQMRGYGGKLSFDPGRQNEVEDRLALFGTLKRKYGPTLASVIAYREKIDREIEELADIDSAREGLRRKLAAAGDRLRSAGEKISAVRRDAALRLKKSVEGELKGLGMAKASFEVRLEPLERPGLRGMERCYFLLSANPGEEPRPLARVASGGELSRLMLALRRAAPEGESVPSLIFDEVDAGVGGVAATSVGEKLKGLSRGPQILCITHLPQVAAFADRHYRVEKREAGGRTVTALALLEGEERVQEMARMLGGARVTDRTLEHAREIIAQSSLEQVES